MQCSKSVCAGMGCGLGLPHQYRRVDVAARLLCAVVAELEAKLENNNDERRIVLERFVSSRPCSDDDVIMPIITCVMYFLKLFFPLCVVLDCVVVKSVVTVLGHTALLPLTALPERGHLVS